MTDANDLTKALGGKWFGRYGCAPCPVCQPQRQKSQHALTVADGRTGLPVLDCKKGGCDFLDILAAAGLRSGDYRPPDAATLDRRAAEQQAEANRRAAQAQRLWQEAQPIAGTPAETYLRKARGITSALPETLRFLPACWHPSAKRYPALVAGGDGFAVHRTYLRSDGAGKADLAPAKSMLGGVKGGAVRLCGGSGSLWLWLRA